MATELLELDMFTPDNCISKQGLPNTPRISVTQTGTVRVNGFALDKLKVTKGSKLAIGQSKKENEFYIVNVGPSGSGFNFKEHTNKAQGRGASLQNKALTEKIFNVLDPNFKKKALRFTLAPEELRIKTGQHGETKTGCLGFWMRLKEE